MLADMPTDQNRCAVAESDKAAKGESGRRDVGWIADVVRWPVSPCRIHRRTYKDQGVGRVSANPQNGNTKIPKIVLGRHQAPGFRYPFVNPKLLDG